MGTESLFLHEPLYQEKKDIKFNTTVLTQQKKSLELPQNGQDGIAMGRAHGRQAGDT